MAQTKAGAAKARASSLGISVEAYQSRVSSGEKWCTRCKDWHSRSAFGSDSSRLDGLTASCREAKAALQRSTYVPTGGAGRPRGWLVPSRPGDKKQARRRVNYLVEQGRIPHPNDLPCVDCGHLWRPGERRHEYDHHKGYCAKHQLSVESVCSACHHRRENER